MKSKLHVIVSLVVLIALGCAKKSENYKIIDGKLFLNSIEITEEDRLKDQVYVNVKEKKEDLKLTVVYFINCILSKDSDGLLSLIEDNSNYDVIVPEGMGNPEHLSKKQIRNNFKNHGLLYKIYFDPDGFRKAQKNRKDEDIQKSFYEIVNEAVKNNIRISDAHLTSDIEFNPEAEYKMYSASVFFRWDKMNTSMHSCKISLRYNFTDNKWYIDDLMFTW